MADLNDQAARDAAARFDVPKVYDSAGALLADAEIDAVVLALITGVRGEVALEALEAGKHVLLEKPPAMNLAELERIKAAAGDRVVASCSSRLTFNDVAEKARAVVAAGELGTIRTIHVRCLQGVGPFNPDRNPPEWRVRRDLNGGGYLVNWGVYDLDFMLYVLGDAFEPGDVLASAWPVAPHLANGRVDPDSNAECHVVALVRGRGGETLFLERGEFTALPKSMRWQIVGEKAALSLGMLRSETPPTLTLHRADANDGLVSETLLEDYGEDVQHRMPVRDFAEAIRAGRPPRTGFDRAVRIQRILDAVYQSLDTASTA